MEACLLMVGGRRGKEEPKRKEPCVPSEVAFRKGEEGRDCFAWRMKFFSHEGEDLSLSELSVCRER